MFEKKLWEEYTFCEPTAYIYLYIYMYVCIHVCIYTRVCKSLLAEGFTVFYLCMCLLVVVHKRCLVKCLHEDC